MKRTFNYTGRRSIRRQDVSVTVRLDGKVWAFDAECRFAPYKFPHNAEVWVEAHRQNIWMQWPWGTVSGMRASLERRLSEFGVRVVHPQGPEHHKLLGEVDQIQPTKAGDASDRRRHLIVPVPDALDQQLWRLDFEQEPPQLLVNKDAKPSWKEMARSPHFIALVYPEVLRSILSRILLENEWSDDDDEEDWQSDWIRFARNLGGLASMPPEHQKTDRETWIEDAVAAFARRMQLRTMWDLESERQSQK